jgi:transcriptional regulator with GAF, ATPase, and Fis domain
MSTPEVLQPAAMATLLRSVAESAAAATDAALVRVWLMGPGDQCATCPMLAECADRSRCLHLLASAGVSTRIDGPYRRFPIGARAVGDVVRTLAPHLAGEPLAASGIAEPAWLAAHRVRGFVALPLERQGECLGVLALFTRRALTSDDLPLLALAAGNAALAIVHARACAEVDAARARLAADNGSLRRRLERPAGRSGEPDFSLDLLRPLAETERRIIERVLEHAGGRVSGARGAAAILGLKPTTLESRMKKLGVRRPPKAAKNVR